MIMTESFARGTEPADTCHLHVGKSLCTKMGEAAATSVEHQRPEITAPDTTAPAVGTGNDVISTNSSLGGPTPAAPTARTRR